MIAGGDCHLCNFGSFATPERRVIIDINDLDETLPAPWEWDVKRLAASFVLASRNNGHSEDDARDAVLACVRSYREHMAEFSAMRTLDIWYAAIDVEKLIPTLQDKETRKRIVARLAKARQRSVLEHDYPQLVHTTGLAPTIKENPPLIYHWREEGHGEVMAIVQKAFADYRETLPEHRRLLLDRFKMMDFAMKVVGVGSVGTYCGVMLLMAGDKDPLFLQVKQARPSVLEAYAGKSVHANHGQRIVIGHQLMQSASDLFLGWTEAREGRQFYIRQLKDMKVKPLVEVFTPSAMLHMPRFAAGPWPAPTPVPANRPRSAATWARATPSTRRLPISPARMPIRANVITKPSSRPCGRASWKHLLNRINDQFAEMVNPHRKPPFNPYEYHLKF